MLVAAIDAGSNTLRLLIGRIEDGRVVPELYQRRICRLAGQFSQQEGLSPESRERTLSVFQEFSSICNEVEVRRIRAVGTAAFRQAVNGEEFARLVCDTTGLPLEIINGEDEAFHTAMGVLNALDPVPAHTLVFDIGGGSTEFILCTDRKVIWSSSLPLGVVHLTESFTASSDRQTEISKTLRLVQKEIEQAGISSGVDMTRLSLVGTAGSVTTLAALDMQMTDYDWRQVNNYSMSYSVLQEWYQRLWPMSPRQREALPGMEKGRGDLIIAGLEIVLGIMKAMHSDRLLVSDFGILEGLLLSRHDSTESRSFR